MNYVVITRFDEDISWVKDISNNYIIYNKGNNIDGYNYVNKENFGGNQYDILSFIYENYNNLPDVMVFLQGNPFDHCPKDKLYEYINNTKFTVLDSDLKFEEDHSQMRKYINEYNEKYNYTCKYRSLDEYMNTIFEDYQHQYKYTFARGSQYVVEKERCLYYSIEFWKKLMDFISNEVGINGGTEAHFTERVLYHVFNNTYKEKIYDEKIQGKTFTSNHVKLLKHLDKLKDIQDGKRASPVMFHMSPCNPCNLSCSFCCFANRTMKEMLTLEQMKKAIDQFRELGTTGLEFCVSKDEIIPYFIGKRLVVDTIDNVVEKQEGSSFTITDGGEHLNEDIKVFLKKDQKEPLYKITLQTGRHIKVTKSHSIYFYENNKIMYKPVSEAKIDDLVVVSKKVIRGEEIKMNTDYAKLLGFFVAEGSYSFIRQHIPHGIHFTFDKYDNEFKYIDDVCNTLTKIGYKYTLKKHKKGNKTSISVYNKDLCIEFLKLGVGEGSRKKRVPNCILNGDVYTQIAFLTGLFAGDGTFRNNIYFKKGKGYNRNSLQLKTASQLLQKTVGFLFQQLDINSTFSEGISPSCTWEGTPEGRPLKARKYYTVNVDGRDNLIKLESIIHYMDKKLIYKAGSFPNSRFKPLMISDDVMALPVKKIEIVEKEEFVYDLSVGDTHRFLSSFGILCSNTGGGEPTLHPQFDKAVNYAYEKGFKIGVCTNGTMLKKIKSWDKMSWVRLGMYGFTEGYTYDLSVFDGLDIKVSGAYVWDENIATSTNPNITGKHIDNKSRRVTKNIQTTEHFNQMLEWVEQNKIPTRIAFNAIKSPEEVMKDIETIRDIIKDRDLKYAFLSDFNYKGVRRNDHCYMHMVKPCVFTDGNVYVCPSAELSPENNYMVNQDFKICDIDGILDFYNNTGVTQRHHGCSFCKYAMQNELIDDILTQTDHNDFA